MANKHTAETIIRDALQATEAGLRKDISQWVADSREVGEQVPDFWNELDTTNRLAAYLTLLGYHKNA